MQTGAVGILGVGRLGEAVARAVLRLPDLRELHVTPRSAERVARLSAEDARVTSSAPAAIAAACDILVVALRPDDARAVLSAIDFEPRHQVVSVMAEIGLEELRALTAGAGSGCRVLVMPSVAEGGQLLPLYPRTAAVEHLFGRDNELFALDSEHALMTYWSITGLLSSVMMVGDVAERWLVSAGIDRERATAYTRTLFSDVHAASARGFAAGLDHVSTPGGLNVMMHERLVRAGMETELARGLDDLRRRLLAAISRGAGLHDGEGKRA